MYNGLGDAVAGLFYGMAALIIILLPFGVWKIIELLMVVYRNLNISYGAIMKIIRSISCWLGRHEWHQAIWIHRDLYWCPHCKYLTINDVGGYDHR